MSEVLSRGEFFDLAAKWCGKPGEKIVLCENPVDMMRFRILLHEGLYVAQKESSLFHVQLLTIDHWLRKSIALVKSRRKPASLLAQKALLVQILNDPEIKSSLKVIAPLVELPGFRRELLRLWQLRAWHGFALGKGGKSSLEATMGAELDIIMNQMEQGLERSGHVPLAHFLSGEAEPVYELDRVSVLVLFPTHLTLPQQKELTFLDRFYRPDWSIVPEEGAVGSKESVAFFHSLGEGKPKPVWRVMWVSQAPEISKELLFAGAPLLKTKRGLPLYLHRAVDSFSEAFFCAWRAASLVHAGVSPHQVLILYADVRTLFLLQYAMSRYGLELDVPELYLAAGKSYVAYALSWIKALSLKEVSPAGAFGRDDLSEFLESPVANPGFFLGKFSSSVSLSMVAEFLESRVSFGEKLTLKELAGRLGRGGVSQKGTEETKLTREAALRALGVMEKKKPLFASEDLPSNYAHAFASLLLDSTLHHSDYIGEQEQNLPEGFDSPSMIRAEEFLKRVIKSMANLDTCFPGKISRSDFFSIMLQELTGAGLPYGMAADSIEGFSQAVQDSFDQTEAMKVPARRIAEGVHSPVDYLLVTGLAHSSFPQVERVSSFLLYEESPERFFISLNHDQLSERFKDSLNLVEKGVFLTFSSEVDPVPSRVIFDLLREREPWEESSAAKERALQSKARLVREIPPVSFDPDDLERLPFYAVDPGDFPGGSADIYRERFQERRSEKYRDYTGVIAGARGASKEMMSPSHIEELARCPQSYWYRRLLKLQAPRARGAALPFERVEAGNLFHKAARSLVDQMKALYPEMTYAEIAAQPGIFDLVYSSFHDAKSQFMEDNPVDLPIVYEARVREVEESFYGYFTSFLKHVQPGASSVHPLAGYMPLAAEAGFEGVSFGPFLLKGSMDRIDYDPQSKTLCVLDYKTGKLNASMGSPEEIFSLRRFQLPAYAKAVASLAAEMGVSDFTRISAAYLGVNLPPNGSELIYWLDEAGAPVCMTPQDLEKPNPCPQMEKALHTAASILDEGYFFAVGHKEGGDPERSWSAPCSYCDYGEICDRRPFEMMMERLENDPLGKAYLETMYRA